MCEACGCQRKPDDGDKQEDEKGQGEKDKPSK